MNQRWKHAFNYEAELLDFNGCFNRPTASCRDLSWLMIDLLRSQNLAARFVSGYGPNPKLEGHELHAWVEAWIPGAGWFGLDPASGKCVDDRYVPVCASHHPAKTLPVQGSYSGKAISRLKTLVRVEEI